MTRIFSASVALVLTLSILVGFGPTVAMAAETTETPTPAPEPTETADATDTDEIEGQPIDEDVSLKDWSYSDGTFTLTFENTGERPASVTLTESTQPDEGAYQFTIREERLLPGETTITMNTKISGGESAVSITTQQSRADGSGIVVSTGQQGANPFAPFGGTSGVLSGVGLSIVMSGGAAGWVLWREETGVIKA